MKVLFITETNPFPTLGGEKIRTANLIKVMLANGISVHLVEKVQSSGNEDFSHPNLKRYSYVKLFEEGLFSVVFLIKMRLNLLKLVKRIVAEYEFDAVFLDYYLIGNYINFFKKKSIKVIYSTHNVESQLSKQRSASTVIQRLKIYFLYQIQSYHEKKYFRQTDKLIVVSEKDAMYYKNFLDDIKIEKINNFIDLSNYKFTKEKLNYVLFPANFNAYQNIEGLKWFLEKIWNSFLAAKTKLYVVGFNAKKVNGLFSNELLTSVEFIDGAKDMVKYFEEAKAVVVPILQGSGSRIKILEAMACGTIVVSTTKGAEGIDHKGSVWIADDPKQFRSLLINALASEDELKTENAYKIVQNQYSFESNAKKLIELLN